jgi:hypothetical protein
MTTAGKIIITALVSIIVVGGGTYYLMQRQIDSVKSDNNAKVSDLSDQISNLGKQLSDAKSAAQTTATATTTTPATATTPAIATSWKNYTNAKYGFSLTLDDYWKNFEVLDIKADNANALSYLYVCVPTTSTTWPDKKAGMFCPFVVTAVATANKSAFEQSEDPEMPTYIASSSAYAFYYSTAQDRPADGVNVMNDIKSIVATFKAN